MGNISGLGPRQIELPVGDSVTGKVSGGQITFDINALPESIKSQLPPSVVSGLNVSDSSQSFINSLPTATLSSLNQLGEVAKNAVSGGGGAANAALQSKWGDFIADVGSRLGAQVDVGALVQYVLREVYMNTTQELMFYAEKTKFYNDMKKSVREELTRSLKAISDATKNMPAGLDETAKKNQPITPFGQTSFAQTWDPTQSASAQTTGSSISQVQDAKRGDSKIATDLKTAEAGIGGKISGTNGVYITASGTTADNVKAFLSANGVSQTAATTMVDQMLKSPGIDLSGWNITRSSTGDWMMSNVNGKADANGKFDTLIFDKQVSTGISPEVTYRGTRIWGDPHVDEFGIDKDGKPVPLGDATSDWHYGNGTFSFTAGDFTLYTMTEHYAGADPKAWVTTGVAAVIGNPNPTTISLSGKQVGTPPITENSLNQLVTSTNGAHIAMQNTGPNEGQWAIQSSAGMLDITPQNFSAYLERGMQTGATAGSTDYKSYASFITNFGDLESYKETLEQKLQTLGEDAQLAQLDLQNVLQRQQQTIQSMSNISKMLHDTAMSIIRKIG